MTGTLYRRRRVLALGFAAAAVPAGARAFQIQEMPPGIARSYLAACEAPARHAELLAEIDARLEGRALGDAERQRVRAEARCPICGCALAAAQPTPPGDAPF